MIDKAIIKQKIGKAYYEKLISINVGENISFNDQEIRCIEQHGDRKTFDYFDRRDLADWMKIFKGIRLVAIYNSEEIGITLINFYVLSTSTNSIFQLSQATFDQLGYEIEKRIMSIIGGSCLDNVPGTQVTR